MNQSLIVGSQGQDGKCLSELLVSRGILVEGIFRGLHLDLTNPAVVENLLITQKPKNLYYLAAYHHSSGEKIQSEYDLWEKSIETHVTAPSILLEGIRLHSPKTKFFYASSSLVFGPGSGKLNEESPLQPDAPYSITKSAGMSICQYYRKKHHVFASTGILFNHESEYRASKFLSKKIVESVLAIQNGSKEKLRLGSLSAQVDWGYARDYVDAMTKIMDLSEADDFIVSSGKLHSVQDFVEAAFSYAGLKWQDFVVEDGNVLHRNIPARLGDHSKLTAKTDWKPKTEFKEMIRILLNKEGVRLV